MTTKKLSELEVLEALGEETYAVVEENGEAKRYPAGGFGAVKSVNGVTPDEAGNVEVEIPEHTWESLPDKPFDEVEVEIPLLEDSETRGYFYSNETGGYYSFGCYGLPNAVTFEVGKAYKVVVNGKEYTAICEEENKLGDTTLWFDDEGNAYHDYSFSVHGFNASAMAYNMGSIIDYQLTVCLPAETDEGQVPATVSVYKLDTAAKPLDEKYIPKAEAVADVTEAPTAEDFNALLASLRAAGYMNS